MRLAVDRAAFAQIMQIIDKRKDHLDRASFSSLSGADREHGENI
jgi:hypothetical protein